MAMLPASLLNRGARAATPWPTSSMSVVSPFPPGGATDLVAWPIGAEINRLLGVPVNIEYRTGEAGAVGNASVAHAQPNGSTLLVSVTSLAYLPDAGSAAAHSSHYKLSDLRPIACMVVEPFMLAVPASAPWKTIEEYIADAKAHPGIISFSSSGSLSTQHIAIEMLMSGAGIRMKHHPYGGTGPAVKALIAGEVQSGAIIPGLLKQHVAEGRLRVLASWGSARNAKFPDVRTFTEIGLKNVEFNQWVGLFAPAALPDELVTRLRETVRIAASQQGLIKMFERAGSPLQYMDAPEFERVVAADRARFTPIIQGIQLQR